MVSDSKFYRILTGWTAVYTGCRTWRYLLRYYINNFLTAYATHYCKLYGAVMDLMSTFYEKYTLIANIFESGANCRIEQRVLVSREALTQLGYLAIHDMPV